MSLQSSISIKAVPRSYLGKPFLLQVGSQNYYSESNSEKPIYIQPEVLGLGALVLLVLVIKLIGGTTNKKGKLATSYLGGARELASARKNAYKQIAARKHNSVSLWINGAAKRANAFRQFIAPDATIYLPDLQRGTAIVGGPGSGKTYSSIDPMVCSAIRCGYPIILYDYKYPAQTSRHIALAAEFGYDIHVFAPGFPESGVLNVLEAMESEEDVETARQISTVLNRNMRPVGSTPDAFFGPAQDQLSTAIIQFAKQTRMADLITCQSIINIKNLQKRVAASPHINLWVQRGFDQLKASSGSDKTLASIKATTIANFQRFVSKKLIPTITGRSTIPAKLEGKQLVILGIDRERVDAVRSLVAIALDTLVTKNLAIERRDPLCLFLDELPTLQLPRIAEWLNTGREDGLVAVLGFQNYSQLEDAYGRATARSILGGCSTKLVFNPQDYESAQTMSNYVGNLEIRRKSKSTSHGKGSTNRTIGEQDHVRKVIEPSDLLRYPTGKCLIVNPGFSNNQEANIAIERKLSVCKQNLQMAEISQNIWPQVCQQLQGERYDIQDPDSALKLRSLEVERVLKGEAVKNEISSIPPADTRGVFFRDGQPNPQKYMRMARGAIPSKHQISLNLSFDRRRVEDYLAHPV